MKEKGNKVIEHQAGLVPVYNPKQQIQKRNILLIGDAATQVKATTGGGVVHGLLAAKQLSKPLRHYEKNCKRHVNKDLKLSLLIRKVMDRFSEKDYDELVNMFSKDKLKRIIQNNDRDFPRKFVLKLIAGDPRLLKFGKKILF